MVMNGSIPYSREKRYSELVLLLPWSKKRLTHSMSTHMKKRVRFVLHCYFEGKQGVHRLYILSILRHLEHHCNKKIRCNVHPTISLFYPFVKGILSEDV